MKDVETRYDTSYYELDRPSPKEKIKIGYLIDDCDENKKAKGTKSCVRKGELNFEEYKHCLEPTRVEYKPTRTK